MTTGKTLLGRPFSDGYLQAYSEEHVFYEIDMLFWCGGLISKPIEVRAQSAGDARRTVNLVVEGFGIHLRNVVDFLYLPPKNPTDVLASDFCDAGIWDSVRPPLSRTLDAARIRANKELAHLTTARQFGMLEAKRWDAVTLLAEIRSLLKLFVSNARASVLSPRVMTLI